jgi:hypothetical protein
MIAAETALAVLDAGFAVIPPKEDGSKRPDGPWRQYVDRAPDRATVAQWYANGRAGIGTICGAASGHLEMLELEGRAVDTGMLDALFDLADDNGAGELLRRIADAYMETSPSGGVHLLYRVDGGARANSKLARRITDNGDIEVLIETRGQGGYTILAPTGGHVHPTGGSWSALHGSIADIVTIAADERDVLHALCFELDEMPIAAPEPESAPIERPWTATTGDSWFDTVVDDYNQRTTWAQVLTGWTHSHRLGDIDYWTRPGKDARHGHSATTNATGTDRLIAFSSALPAGIEPWDGTGKATSYDRFSITAIVDHNGDRTAAAHTLNEQGYGRPRGTATDVRDLIGDSLLNGHTPDPAADDAAIAGDWAPIDLAAIVDGATPPTPAILQPLTGPALLYAGRVNSIFGESGSGKTWIELAAIAEILNAGGTAMLIDLEDTPHGIVSRLRSMGIAADVIIERFLYLSPHTGWNTVAQAAIATLIDQRRPQLVCIDSTGEAMAAGGVKGNDDDDVARWFVSFPKFIARRGPAVVILDHVPKDPNAPSSYAIGSQRKIAAVDGAAYRVEPIRTPSRTDDGLLKLIVAKDRHGNHTKGQTAAEVHINHDLIGTVHIALTAATAVPRNDDGSLRPTLYMERVSRALEATPGLSGRRLEDTVKGKGEHIREALGLLIIEGYVGRNEAARGFSYDSLHPYREGDDTRAHHTDEDPKT